MIDKREFAMILAKLGALYPRFKPEPVTIDAYYDVLGDLDVGILQAAALQIGSEAGAWFPTAGDLRARAFDLIEKESGLPTPGAAWDEVLRLQSLWKPPEREDFSHPAIYDAYKGVGGATGVGMTPEDKLFTTRARFMDSYKTLAKREQVTQRMLPQVKSAVAELMAKATKQLTAKGGRDEQD